MTLSEDAQTVVDLCLARGLTLATGESLTGGLVAATLAEIPGCSSVLRGSVVAYHADLKRDLLDVPDEALKQGVVSHDVALAMAVGAARMLAADIGVGTTGVAGPEPHDGEPPGSVWIAISGPHGSRAEHLMVDGGRAEVRRQTVAACFQMVMADLRE